MSAKKYLNEDGSIHMAFSSSVPGLGIVPDGRSIEEAVPMSDVEYQEHVKKIDEEFAKRPKEPTVEDLLTEITKLKSDVEKLKTPKQ